MALGNGTPPVCRLGLATRGGTRLAADDVRHAVDHGVNYLNWCGHPDGMSKAIAALGADRAQVFVAFQLSARTATEASAELDEVLRELKTEFVDAATFYYVEAEAEWDRIIGEGGAYQAMVKARQEGKVRLLGLTSHQRPLAAKITAGELQGPKSQGVPSLDLLMIRYNAAHRGAEEEVFPVTDALGIPVVTFTAQRWGALKEATPADPMGFSPPLPRAWYRFALSHPSVAATLMAPENREELEDNLALLEDWREPSPQEHTLLAEHGARVRQHAGTFW